MINHQERQIVLILLVSLAIVANAQRPLNTTNTSGYLTEPFFVKPTSTSSRNAIPEMRAAGGSKPDRERPPYPPDSYYSHGYIQEHPNGQAQPPRQQITIPNKLHKVDRERMKKLESSNSNSKKGSFNIFRNIAHDPNHELNQRSENISIGTLFIRKTNEPNAPNFHVSDRNLSVSQADNYDLHMKPPQTAFNDLKNTLNNKSYLHTPSPPPYSEDYDFDEKLGVKCSFEKPCAWTYDLNVEGSNFEVTTGVNLTQANITG
jgi:hypothetical protein